MKAIYVLELIIPHFSGKLNVYIDAHQQLASKLFKVASQLSLEKKDHLF